MELEPFEWFDPNLNFASLTSLTSLTPSQISVAVLPMLSSLPNLRTLYLPFDADRDWFGNELGEEFKDAFEGNLDAQETQSRTRVRGAAVLPHLTSHTALTSLRLYGVAFAENDLATLCHLLPRLEQLTLGRATLSTLRGLSSLRQLREFDLSLNDGCNVGEANLIEQIGACKMLERLTLDGVAPLSPSVYEQLQSSSALLPRLRSFTFSSPAIPL